MTTSTIQKKSSVEVKVIAVNVLNQYAEQFFNYEREHFKQYVGVNIFKVDGSIKAKYEHEKQSFKGQMPDGTWVDAHYWFTSSYGRFDIHVKICVNGGSYDVKPATAFCQYEDMALTMFKIEDGKLVDAPDDTSHLQTRYNVEELEAISMKIKEAAKHYDAVRSEMPSRFHDVFYVAHLSR